MIAAPDKARLALARYLKAERAFARVAGDCHSIPFIGAYRDFLRAEGLLTAVLWLTCEPVEGRRHIATVGADSEARVRRHPDHGGRTRVGPQQRPARGRAADTPARPHGLDL